MGHKKKEPKSVKPDVDLKIKEMIDDLENETLRMNDWERDEFFPSVSDQFTNRGTLSDNQYNCLEKIHKRLIK
jgi:hypothetical protein